jgi:predicted Zn-dependent protease
MPDIPTTTQARLRRLLLSAFLALIGFTLAVAPALRADNIALPEIGASAGTLITPAEEARLGRQFMRSIRQALPVVDDPLLAEYVENLGAQLVAKADRGTRNFHFFLIDQPVINAFAGPGGYIGVYSGLILATESESELASVVAHEIAHITQDHLMRTFENASRMNGPMAALLLAAILLGSSVSSDLGIAAAVGIQAASAQQQINFTRDNEEEADRVGIQILTGADFDPHAMPIFFERLAKASRLYENNAPEFLRTHPVTTNRIADALGRASAYPYRQRMQNPDYFLVRASLREQAFEQPRDAVTHFAATLRDGRYREEYAERYAYAQALLRNHQAPQAKIQSQQLLEKFPRNIAYVLLDAKIDDALGVPKAALDSISQALQWFPGSYPLSRYYAELALRHDHAQAAARILDEAISRRPEEPSLHHLRSRAAAALGDKKNAYLFLADAHVFSGQLENALQQLESAIRLEGLDFYDKAKMQAKIDRIRAEIKAEKADDEKR